VNLDEGSTVKVDAMLLKASNLSNQSMQFQHYKNSLVLKLGEIETEGNHKLAQRCGDH
jgi:hypothetical protein